MNNIIEIQGSTVFNFFEVVYVVMECCHVISTLKKFSKLALP